MYFISVVWVEYLQVISIQEGPSELQTATDVGVYHREKRPEYIHLKPS